MSTKTFRIYPRLQLDITWENLIKTLLSFGQISDINQSLSNIKSFWQVDKEVVVTFSVRTAFDLLLQSLKLPPGSEVLISAINIQDMVEIVKLHGLIPVPVDISLLSCEPSLELLEKFVSSKTKILLLAHLFGTIVNLQPYVEFCQKHNLILIEDCAQAFAGKKYYGHPQADVSLFSFGPIKSCTALGGAVALVRDKTIANNMFHLQEQYPKKSEYWFFLRVLKFLCLKLLSIPWIYCQLVYLLQILGYDVDSAINSTTRGFSKGDLLSKIRYRPPHHLLWLLAYRLSECEGFYYRLESAENFFNLLITNIIIPGVKADYNSFWLVPILVSETELLLLKLRENSFDATRGNTSLIVIEPCSNHRDLPLPENAKYLMEHILYLPVNQNIPETELHRLAQCINVLIATQSSSQ
ncbi:MAG: DegT/DnrJ/EryC1/StrS family aminotransferase [Nostocaceae cyanobacterium]|nr:DegT/DnrJ/EryC1/StrS family aminotransferase [Nostocaceae cyanobacterium]